MATTGRRRRPPKPSDSVDTCPHLSFRELIPGVMVCRCGLNLDDIKRRAHEAQTTAEQNQG
ncbi:hypothetical protein [Gordonia sihwensis]|uniref:hypothetical protein n=1 Tax=Gordonia sihwensis TaxID=173559 RepID=UPI0012E03C47|nr:hypothetical protein [Gordonia sihwensis]